MKKIVVFIAGFAFAAANVIAQDPYQPTPTDKIQQTITQPATPATPAQPVTPNQQSSNVQHQMKDGIVFRDGKVWNVMAGKSVAVNKETTLANGTKVKSNGTVVMKDGTQTTLSEGDYISMDGKLERAKPNRMTEQNDINKDKDEE